MGASKYNPEVVHKIHTKTGYTKTYIRQCLRDPSNNTEAAHIIRNNYENYTKKINEILNL